MLVYYPKAEVVAVRKKLRARLGKKGLSHSVGISTGSRIRRSPTVITHEYLRSAHARTEVTEGFPALVRTVRLELTSLPALASKTSASTNFATSARHTLPLLYAKPRGMTIVGRSSLNVRASLDARARLGTPKPPRASERGRNLTRSEKAPSSPTGVFGYDL